MRTTLGLAVAALAACWTAPEPSTPPGAATVALPRGPYATRALAGPYASRAEWCRDLLRRLRARDAELEQAAGCLAHDPIVTHGTTRLGSNGCAIAVVEIAAFQAHEDHAYGPRCALLLHGTDRRIWVAEHVGSCLADPARGSLVRRVTIDELAWRDVIRHAPSEAIGPELVLTTTRVRTTGAGEDETLTTMIVCGAGTSRTPRCTPPIPVRRSGAFDVAFHPVIAATGELHFEPAGDEADLGFLEDALAAGDPGGWVLGTHPLRFP